MTRPKRTDLLIGFIERVSWRVLEEYPEIIRDMIRGQSGVYALYHKDKLYYVGLAKNLTTRIKTHLKDRHEGAWDRFSVYLTSDDAHIKQLESLLLRIAKPSGNKVSGAMGGSANLFKALHREMSERDADRRARLLGGQVARRRRRSRTARGRGSLLLAGLVEHRIPLKARYKGHLYRASLRRDGSISYRGKRHDSPTAAAKKIVGHAVNGWVFWTYQAAPRNWVQLGQIKK